MKITAKVAYFAGVAFGMGLVAVAVIVFLKIICGG